MVSEKAKVTPESYPLLISIICLIVGAYFIFMLYMTDNHIYMVFSSLFYAGLGVLPGSYWYYRNKRTPEGGRVEKKTRGWLYIVIALLVIMTVSIITTMRFPFSTGTANAAPYYLLSAVSTVAMFIMVMFITLKIIQYLAEKEEAKV